MFKNNEYFGLAVEKLLCEKYNLQFNTKRDYDLKLPESIRQEILFNDENCQELAEHTGYLNNHYDFKNIFDQTVSIKTNISGSKVCPQTIGQTTKRKILCHFNCKNINEYKLKIFNEPELMLNEYLKHLFSCDFVYYINLTSGESNTFEKIENPKIDLSNVKLRFSKTPYTWNESVSIKINNLPLAEFQIHSNRNCVKCRFNMSSITKLIKQGILKGIIITKFNKMNTTKKDLKPQSFSYIGSKTKLLDFVKSGIQEYTGKNINEISSFLDLFSGTGVVSQMMLNNDCKFVITNDLQYYSYVLSSTLTDKDIDIKKLKMLIKHYNSLDTNNLEALPNDFVYTNYSPNINSERMYFVSENAILIDKIRKDIELLRHSNTLNYNEYLLMIKILLLAVTNVSNTASVYGAYLKKFKKTALKRLNLTDTLIDNLIPYNGQIVDAYNKDALRYLIENNSFIEVVYIDPPYNTRNYSQNFHILETIARYDYPLVKGITGLRNEVNEDSKKFCSKTDVYNNFKDLITSLNCKYIFMSYSSDGILDLVQIYNILYLKFKNIVIKTYPYKKFKSSKTQENKTVDEYLICAVAK